MNLTRRAALLAGLAAVWSPALADDDWASFDDTTGHILMSGTLNGVAGRMLIDSGAQAVAVTKAFADKAGLEPAGQTTMLNGSTGSVAAAWSGPVSVAFGRQVLNLPRAVILDRAPFGPMGAVERLCDVIVGHQAFETTPVEIDFAQRRMAVRPGAFDTTGAVRLPLRKGTRGMRCVEISIEGGKPLWALLDLGSDAPLSVDARVAARSGLLKGRPVSTTASTGVSGVAITERATARTLSVGGLVLRDAPFNAPKDRMKGRDWSAVIGYPAISRLGRMIVDYPSGALWVFPGGVASPFPKNRNGLNLRPLDGGGWTVVHVARGGPAASAGWTVGETVAKVNGEAAYPPGEAYRDHPAGSRATYEMADGSVRVIERKDYY